MTTYVKLGQMSCDHVNQRTHVHAEIWEIVPPGLRKYVTAYDLTFLDASLDMPLIKAAVKQQLGDAGIIGPDVQVFDDAEVRAQ